MWLEIHCSVFFSSVPLEMHCSILFSSSHLLEIHCSVLFSSVPLEIHCSIHSLQCLCCTVGYSVFAAVQDPLTIHSLPSFPTTSTFARYYLFCQPECNTAKKERDKRNLNNFFTMSFTFTNTKSHETITLPTSLNLVVYQQLMFQNEITSEQFIVYSYWKF